jgi:hypothetical protein
MVRSTEWFLRAILILIVENNKIKVQGRDQQS